MSEYRFHLQKYKQGNRYACPQCGRKRCFARYIDEQGQIVFPDNVGRCDHEQSCGYHYSPSDYFKDNPDANCNDDWRYKTPIKECRKEKPLPTFIENKLMEQTLHGYSVNPLYRYISMVFDKEETERLFALYKVGTSKKWGGSTIFWQIDVNGNVRTGKIMKYDDKTGHRIKEPHSQVTWVHSELKLPDFTLRQCFFGEHLLTDKTTTKTVAIVESEKTAIIATHFISDFVWLATGGMNGCFNKDAVEVLSGREVVLVPDLGATDKWKSKLPLLQSICKQVLVSNILEDNATDEQKVNGLDIADFLLMTETTVDVEEVSTQLLGPLQACVTHDACLLRESRLTHVLHTTQALDQEGGHAVDRTIVALRDTIKRIVEGLRQLQVFGELIGRSDHSVELSVLHAVLVDGLTIGQERGGVTQRQRLIDTGQEVVGTSERA